MAKEYKVSVSLPLSKDLVTRVLKRTKFKNLDEYLNAKLQEDLERLT
tara:strand:- start:1720 stop:1860 length:141 start_codon:yes stop_codon:yes gene_type:complete